MAEVVDQDMEVLTPAITTIRTVGALALIGGANRDEPRAPPHQYMCHPLSANP